jgi:hypothetical protein
MSDIFEELKEIRYRSYEMDKCGKAFNTLGMELMAEKMFEAATVLRLCADNIQKQYAEETNDRLQQAQQSSVNVLQAALAGVQLGKNSN